MIYHKNCN